MECDSDIGDFKMTAIFKMASKTMSSVNIDYQVYKFMY